METATQQAAVVGWLCRPDAYPHHPHQVEHIETHISHVFLAGSSAYKLKKPVKYEFLDFSTLAAREHACREEVRLNRRLAPETYLGVAGVVQAPSGVFQLGGAGQTIDWVVEMRRLPTELTLDSLHRRGRLHPEHIDRLTEVLVRFYRSLSPLQITAEQYRDRCQSHVRGNLQELLAVKHHLPHGMIERIHGFQLQLLLLAPALFDERVCSGRIVDGHGDLRPEHICFSERLAIFDCLEFNPDLRRIDVADELAFLAAECDFLGAEWVSPKLFQMYQERSGDRPPAVLLDFYKSYRACVRAKVAALRADQLQGPDHEEAKAEAKKHLSLADRYVGPWLRPLVLVVGGLAGTGKTTLAKAVAHALGAEVMRTDTVRQELFGAGDHAAEIDGGIYNADARQHVYDEMLRRAAALHKDRISVVLDGTFSISEPLLSAQELSADPSSDFLAIECVCRPEIAQARISGRLTAGGDASEARPEIHDRQRIRWQAWPAAIPQVQIDTEQPLETQLQCVINALAEKRWFAVPLA